MSERDNDSSERDNKCVRETRINQCRRGGDNERETIIATHP